MINTERLKQQAGIKELFEYYGFELKRVGSKDYKTSCPFHEDKDPSFTISTDNNIWHCFGCSKGGDVIDFVMEYKNVRFKEAVKLLSRIFSVKKESDEISANLSTSLINNSKKIKKIILNITPKNQQLLNKVSDLYFKTFKEDQRGWEYLKSRGIQDKSITEYFKVGYANGKIFDMIPKQGEIRDELKEIGLITENDKEFFYNCVVFPIYDNQGNVIYMYGRKIGDDYGKHFYLKGGHRGVFNANSLKTYDEIIIAESIIDALSIYQAGFKNVIPIYGIKGYTESHNQLLKTAPLKSIFFLLDGDSSGRDSSEAYKDTLDGEFKNKINIDILNLPDDEDANTYLIKNGKDKLYKLIQTQINEINKKRPQIQFNNSEKEDTKKDDELIITYCKRRYIIRGIEGGRNKLKVNIKCEEENSIDKKFHIDTVDLYLSRSRKNFIKDVSMLFKEGAEIIEKDLAQIIEKVESFIKEKSRLKEKNININLTSKEIDEAINYAKNPNLITNILKDIEDCGYIGEEMNKLVSYLAMTSRKMKDPLSVLVISGSGAGKSSLQDTILNLCPEEDLIKLTSITGKALFYKEQNSLAHKVLAVEEEAGAEDASYAIRNLISSKALTIEATIKDNYTGKITTMENKVSGPTAVFKTTTNPDTDPETKNRFIVLSVDESIEQTRKILDYQRKMQTLEGIKIKSKKEPIIKKHKNFQRMLKTLLVVNEYVEHLSFLDDRIQVRREYPKYLNLINTIAFLRQHQKEIKTLTRAKEKIEYIEADIIDLKIAKEIVEKIFWKNIDELSEPSRRLLNIIYEFARKRAIARNKFIGDMRFTRREIREYCSWSEYQLRTHVKQLIDLEYLIPVKGKHGTAFEYKVAYDGDSKSKDKFINALKKIEKIIESRLRQKTYNTGEKVIHNFEGLRGHFEGGSRALRGQGVEVVTS